MPTRRRMQLVLVVPGGVDPPGGARVIPFVHDLVRRLASEHQVRVVALGHDDRAGSWDLFGAEVVNVPIGGHGRADVARAVAATERLARRADVVHGWWATLPGLAAAVAARTHRRPSVVSLAGGELTWLPDIGYGGARTPGTRALTRTALRLATATTAASQWLRGQAAARGVHVDDLLVLGADRHRWADTDAPVDRSRLVHVGSLNAVKDQTLLLRAFAIAAVAEPTLRLDLCGVDTLDGFHRRLADELGVGDRVRFRGAVGADKLPAIVRGAGLHLVSSRHEAGPVALVEAATCGVPTLGTEVGHVADLARAAVPAAAVAGATPDEMGAAIVRWVRDDAGRDALAAAARDWALTHDADHTARAVSALHRRLRRR